MTTIDPKTLRGNWNYPTVVRFGPGRIIELPAVCRELGMKPPLDEHVEGTIEQQRTSSLDQLEYHPGNGVAAVSLFLQPADVTR